MGQLPGQQGRELSREMDEVHANAYQNANRMPVDIASRSNFDLQSGDMDPEEIARKIYPILAFRDHIVKAINNTLDKVGHFFAN